MKRTLYKIFSAAAAMVLAGVTTSCGDYLDVKPLNDVVLENYWTEKKDVISVMNSCYESLENKESILRMEVWGELRSENIVAGSSVPNEMNEVLKETLLPNNALTSWAIMYQTINRCNTVIHYAPGVQEIDPNYTYTELQATIAEATFIRDLCYFYLLRTFGEVPLVFEPSLSDDMEFEVEPTSAFKFQDGAWVIGPALDILIEDLRGVENMAVRRYIDDSEMTNSQAASAADQNSGRVTRCAIYALLAEINLWKGDYDEAIRYCDLVIDYKTKQYEEKKDKLGEINDMMLFNEIPLIRECVEGGTTCGNAYNEIFGTGNSFESLFEGIERGLYAKKMGGGSVNPQTGEFNFAVEEGYLIENGKISYPVKGASLIGNGRDILMNIDKVSNNLARGQGMCGSMSGSIPADVGQPSLRVSSITVGGTANE